MSELKVRLYQASLILAIPGNTENFLRNSTNNSWERDNEYNFAKLYFCPLPYEKII